ncbi:MAG: polysaccharide biosynthesis protein [Sodaliphilus sp.]
MTSNKRIAKNTLMLYIRMFISMLVGLYTSRVVLATLGVEDYGIYGVVGGVVGMMGFLNASMSGATSRFLTFELGKGDKERLAKTFSSALIVHIGIAIVVLILAETVGLWFLSNKLNIPAERMQAAHWVYQLSILSAMFGITQVPYNAAIIAHEKMDVYAYVEILNVSLKLLIVYLLCIGNFDKLILYASLMLAVSILIMMVYRIYAIRQFPEAHFHWIWDKTYLRPLLSFSGWDLYGNACVIARQQGTNFLINIFYGVVFNAASGIATTVQGTISGLAFNIILAFRPQIIKQYAKGNVEEMSKLVGNAVCFTTILFGCMSIPLILETHYIMKAWLGVIPEKSEIFCQILLIASFLGLLNNIWNTCIHATGKIKEISIFSGTFFLISLPIIYVVFQFKAPVESAYLVFILSIVFVNVSNLLIIKKKIPKLKLNFVFLNYIKVIIVLMASYYITSLFKAQMQETFIRLLVDCFICWIIVFASSFIFILNKKQKKSIISKICPKLA